MQLKELRFSNSFYSYKQKTNQINFISTILKTNTKEIESVNGFIAKFDTRILTTNLLELDKLTERRQQLKKENPMSEIVDLRTVNVENKSIITRMSWFIR